MNRKQKFIDAMQKKNEGKYFFFFEDIEHKNSKIDTIPIYLLVNVDDHEILFREIFSSDKSNDKDNDIIVSKEDGDATIIKNCYIVFIMRE